MDQRTALIAEIAARRFPSTLSADDVTEMDKAVAVAELAVSAAEAHERSRLIVGTKEAGEAGPAPIPCPTCGTLMPYREGETRAVLPSRDGSYSALLVGGWYCTEAGCFEVVFRMVDVADTQRHGHE